MSRDKPNVSGQEAMDFASRELIKANYRDTLIAAGLSADDADDIARRTTISDKQSDAPSDDIFGPQIAATQAATAAKTAAAVKKSEAKAAREAKALAASEAQAAAGKLPQRRNPSAPVTKLESRLIQTGLDIAETPMDEYGEFMSFNHAVLCQVGLPRSKTDAREFMRRSGDAWVSVQAGYLDEGKGPIQQPIPYGPMPRLALSWVSSYAVRFKTREIPIGNSASEFLRLIGMEDEGRRHSALKKQMYALAACRLQLGFKGSTFNGQPVERFDAWTGGGPEEQQRLWSGVMSLSESFFTSLQDSAVPLDTRALHALKGSSLALDVYAWLAHRLHRIEGRPISLHWKPIREQFAQEYAGKEPDKDFKKQFLPVLRNVLAVYPKANVKQVSGGLLLMSSPPPIPKKG